jgi:hypothetical protein
MMTKRMIVMAAMLLLAAATAATAQSWKYADESTDKATNLRLEISEASIESIGPTTVKALTRFVRLDPGMRHWPFAEETSQVELAMDFDCVRPRYKLTSEARIAASGYRLQMPEAPAFYEETEKGSLFDTARKMACKAEGK